ncbi:MAG: TonB-dependent receptor [Bacteroidetes bacterium]|nr:TonB-dependent receptor [Bacteroidota bacterium]
MFIFSAILFPQQKATLSGFIRDKGNGESLPFANVLIKDLKIGAATNIEGYFAIPNIPAGKFQVQVSLLGYQTFSFTINTEEKKNIIQNIFLVDQSVQVGEVVISAEREEEKHATQTGRIVMQAKDVASIPTIGEADVFRALQMMPGVKAVSEISSGLNVRGGSSDQNLILLDGTVVYNPSHLFGFFSTFNNDAIKDIDLMKGGFPAEYGGRLSSVLNVTNIDGDRVTTHGKASLSLLSTRLTGEGPLGNGSWFLSGRRTYFDQVIKFVGLDTGDDALPLYYFYDANLKLNQNLSENDKLSLVSYFGQDNLDWGLGDNELSLNMRWGNRTNALKWTHVFSQTLFSNFTASYSFYKAKTLMDFGGFKLGQDNTVDDYSLRSDIDFFWTNEHLLKLGVWWSQYKVTYSEHGDGAPLVIETRPSQFSLYAQDEWTINERWITQFGLRFEYQDLSKSIQWGPRFNARYNLDEYSQIKFATGLYYQFLNAVSAGTENGFSPFDIWIPINNKMKPSRSIDFVLGYETRFFEALTISAETYYKKFYDVLQFKREFLTTTEIELDKLFYYGTGRSYGIELFAQKKIGNLTGTAGYTLAWTYRTFPELNNGMEFMPKYDRRHDITVTGSYQLTDDWKFGMVFTFATGQSYTRGSARYDLIAHGSTFPITLPGPLYNHRLSPYHRLDFSVTKHFTALGVEGNWYVQIYNVYNRRNVWFKQFNNLKNPPQITDVKLLPMIPTVGCDFSF